MSGDPMIVGAWAPFNDGLARMWSSGKGEDAALVFQDGDGERRHSWCVWSRTNCGEPNIEGYGNTLAHAKTKADASLFAMILGFPLGRETHLYSLFGEAEVLEVSLRRLCKMVNHMAFVSWSREIFFLRLGDTDKQLKQIAGDTKTERSINHAITWLLTTSHLIVDFSDDLLP